MNKQQLEQAWNEAAKILGQARADQRKAEEKAQVAARVHAAARKAYLDFCERDQGLRGDCEDND